MTCPTCGDVAQGLGAVVFCTNASCTWQRTSDRPVTVRAMEQPPPTERLEHVPLCLHCSKPATQVDTGLCERHAENWARTQGMIAVLALPARRHDDGEYGRPVVEVKRGYEWQQVTAMWLTATTVSVTTLDSMGCEVTDEAPLAAGVPEWRIR